MQYRQIIREAWVFTQENKRLMKWYAFLPALITTIVSVGYVIYQYFAFITSPVFSDAEHTIFYEIITTSVNFVQSNPNYIMPLLVVGVIIGIIYIFYPTFAQGAMIQIIARKRAGQDVKLISGVKYGVKSFLPLFEYHLILRGLAFQQLVQKLHSYFEILGQTPQRYSCQSLDS